MKLKGITPEQLNQIIKEVNETHKSTIRANYGTPRGRFISFTLRVKSGKDNLHGLGPTGRNLNTLCWHGHKYVMEKIFELEPSAILVSTIARYEGITGFENHYMDTAYKNVGSLMSPMFMVDRCNCS